MWLCLPLSTWHVSSRVTARGIKFPFINHKGFAIKVAIQAAIKVDKFLLGLIITHQHPSAKGFIAGSPLHSSLSCARHRGVFLSTEPVRKMVFQIKAADFSR